MPAMAEAAAVREEEVTAGVLDPLGGPAADGGRAVAVWAEPEPGRARSADPAAVTAEATDRMPDDTADIGPLAALPGEEAGEADGTTASGRCTDDATDMTVEVADVSGGELVVAARACREDSSMSRKTPTATIATCTARTAMRRRIS